MNHSYRYMTTWLGYVSKSLLSDSAKKKIMPNLFHDPLASGNASLVGPFVKVKFDSHASEPVAHD